MSNKIRLASVLGVLVVIATIVTFGVMGTVNPTNTKSATGNTVVYSGTNSGDYQDVTLTFKNYEYQLEPSTLKKGVPVRMTADLDSVYGCMRDVVIPAFDVRKYVREGDNVIEFTPTESGTFNIRCSMNMGRGTFSVSDSDGSVSSYVEESPTGSDSYGGSCGAASGGGCGCGGYPG